MVKIRVIAVPCLTGRLDSYRGNWLISAALLHNNAYSRKSRVPDIKKGLRTGIM